MTYLGAKTSPNLADSLIIRPAVKALITDVRFRTDFSNETELYNAEEIADIISGIPKPVDAPPSLSKTVLTAVKPTFVVRTPYGQTVYAPYGEADPRNPSMWKGRVGTLLALVTGAIFLLGFGTGRLTK